MDRVEKWHRRQLRNAFLVLKLVDSMRAILDANPHISNHPIATG